jgi:glyoxylate reductase
MLGLELKGALLGIVGGGRIGQAVARRAMALGMRIAFASHPSLELAPDLSGAELIEFAELLGQADVVSIHVPLNEMTRHLIDESALRLMRGTSVLVNTSRGPIVDEQALVRALREHWIFAAGLDVYEHEPRLTAGLTELENVVLSPHLGSATAITRSEMARLCAENAVDAIQGRIPRHCVNPEAWPTQSTS